MRLRRGLQRLQREGEIVSELLNIAADGDAPLNMQQCEWGLPSLSCTYILTLSVGVAHVVCMCGKINHYMPLAMPTIHTVESVCECVLEGCSLTLQCCLNCMLILS